MEDGLPFRVIDRTGRNLHWVMINDRRANTVKAFYDSPDCHIMVCPRFNGPGSPQDIESRPCHSEGHDGFFRLKDNVHGWLVEMGLERHYQFEFRYTSDSMEPGWCVGFLDKDNAALFKLTWT